MIKGALERRPVRPLEHAHESAFALVQADDGRQQVIRHNRRQRDGDDEARQDRDDIGLTEWSEKSPFDAGKREQRHEHENDDHRRINDAGPNLLTRGDDDVEDGTRLRSVPVFPEPPEDIFDIDHGVVDEFANGYGEAPERHRVDR